MPKKAKPKKATPVTDDSTDYIRPEDGARFPFADLVQTFEQGGHVLRTRKGGEFVATEREPVPGVEVRSS